MIRQIFTRLLSIIGALILLVIVFRVLTLPARSDVILPDQFGGRLLSWSGGGGTCSNALDFSQGCNSQYISVLGIM